MRRPQRRLIAFLCSLLYASPLRAAPAAGNAAKAAREEVRVSATTGILSDIVMWIAQDRGYFEREGLTLREVHTGRGTPERMAALLSGGVDVERMGYHTAMNTAALRENGFIAVADAAHYPKGKPASGYYLVRKDLAGSVKSFADLRGRKVFAPSPGISLYLDFLRQVEAAGLAESDLIRKDPRYHLSPSLLLHKEMDVGFFTEPTAGSMIRQGLAEAFAGTDRPDHDIQVILVFYSKPFARRAKAARGFMVAYLRAARDLGRMTPSELTEAAKRHWELPGADAGIFQSLHIRPDGEVDVPYLMGIQEYAKSKGLIADILPPDKLVDPSFVRYAVGVLDKNERAPAR
jgi:ABC-type nitrate/sulfonate/bicarbonate transport system substrate-binding protein